METTQTTTETTQTPLNGLEKVMERNHPAAQILMANMIAIAKKQKGKEVMNLSNAIKQTPLNGIKGIGEKTVQLLIENGITTLDELKLKNQDEIFNIIKNPISRKQILDFLASNKEITFREVEE